VKYQATRKLILSSVNENFFSGKFGKGVGSSHTSRNMVWPIALIMQAATATDKSEKLDCLRTLIASSAGTGLLHEAFNVDDIEDYTRPWFAWCNSLFGGLIAHIIHTDLELLDAI
jgi:meiotically up-regulated gene 157 (Mug157) protein